MPDHWQETTLGTQVSVRTGKLDVNASVVDGEFPFFTCSRDTFRIDTPAYSGKSVLVAGNGDLNVKYYEGEFNAYQRTYILQVTDESVLDSLFLFHFMCGYVDILRNQTQGSTIQYLKRSQFTDAPIRIPPLVEQRRIVDVVGFIDSYISALEDQLGATRAARTAVASDLVRSQIDTRSESLAALEDAGLVRLGRGKVISKETMAANPGDFPVYSSAAQNEGRIGSYSEYMFDEELITWSVDGGGHLFHRLRHKFSVTNIGGFLRILHLEQLSYGYLCAVLQDLHSRCSFDWQYKAHPSVIRNEYSKIPLPPLTIQRQIESVVGAFDDQIAALQSQVEAARRLRSGVLSELLSGERLLDESYDVVVGL